MNPVRGLSPRDPRPPHALVVGGSGMLAGVCLALARDGWRVSVLARRRGPIDDLRERLQAEGITPPDWIHPVLADYHDDAALVAALAGVLQAHGPASLAVAWVHSGAPHALAIVAGAIGSAAIERSLDKVPLYQVLGSMTGDPRERPIEPAVAAAPGITLRRVALGWVRHGSRSRWLTHDEICTGVLGAIRSGADVTEVGECSQRPRGLFVNAGPRWKPPDPGTGGRGRH